MYGTERFGFTLYGDNPLHPGRTPRNKGYRENKQKDFSNVFGAGPALVASHEEGYDWDLKVGPDGDFMFRSGWDFLGQELAFQAAQYGHFLIGGVIRPSEMVDLENNLRQIWQDDGRIKTVDNVDAEPDPERTDTVSVMAALTSVEGDYNELEFR